MREHLSFPLPLCGFNVCHFQFWWFSFLWSLSLSLVFLSILSFSLFSVVYDFEQWTREGRGREVGCTSMCAVHLDLSIDTRNREKKRQEIWGKFLSPFLHYFSVPLFLSLSLSLTFLCFSLIILFEGWFHIDETSHRWNEGRREFLQVRSTWLETSILDVSSHSVQCQG